MKRKARYTVNQYILVITITATLGLVASIILLKLIGFPSQGLLLIALASFPVILYSCLRGLRKGLSEHYGFTEANLDDDIKNGDSN